MAAEVLPHGRIPIDMLLHSPLAQLAHISSSLLPSMSASSSPSSPPPILFAPPSRFVELAAVAAAHAEHHGLVLRPPTIKRVSPPPSPPTGSPTASVTEEDLDDDDDDDASASSSPPSPTPVQLSRDEMAAAVRTWWEGACASKWTLPMCPWPECGASVAEPRLLIAHIVEHLHRDFSHCPFCSYRQEGKKFKLLSHLQRHIAAAHKCRCGATFSQTQALMRHRRELRCPLHVAKPLERARSRRRIAIGQLVN